MNIFAMILAWAGVRDSMFIFAIVIAWCKLPPYFNANLPVKFYAKKCFVCELLPGQVQ